jgi:hypothetical protein
MGKAIDGCCRALRAGGVAYFLFIGLYSSVAQAHHSHAMFDETKVVTLQGVVKQFKFSNPHTWLFVTVTGKEGKSVDWVLEGGSVGGLMRLGWTQYSIKAGDKIQVDINPLRSGEQGGSFENRKILVNGVELRIVAPGSASKG